MRDGQFGGGDGVPGGRVDDDDATVGGRLDIDVVDANAGAADDPQSVRRLDHAPGDLCRAAHEQGVVLRDGGDEIVLGESGAHIDANISVLPQPIDSLVGDRVGDEDAE